MTIIKINAIRVPRESGDELAHRFAARAGAVDDADGFQGYELLKPTDDRDQWLVITRWRDEESFQAWLASESFTQGHRSAAERQGDTTPKPVASHSEVWSYVVAGGSGLPSGSAAPLIDRTWLNSTTSATRGSRCT